MAQFSFLQWYVIADFRFCLLQSVCLFSVSCKHYYQRFLVFFLIVFLLCACVCVREGNVKIKTSAATFMIEKEYYFISKISFLLHVNILVLLYGSFRCIINFSRLLLTLLPSASLSHTSGFIWKVHGWQVSVIFPTGCRFSCASSFFSSSAQQPTIALC